MAVGEAETEDVDAALGVEDMAMIRMCVSTFEKMDPGLQTARTQRTEREGPPSD